jgi:predicted transcriptional regulator
VQRYYLKIPITAALDEPTMPTATAVRPVAIKIGDDIKARVKRLADVRQRSAHWLMREAIEQYVEREEKREAFRQDTLKAWDDYRTTGQHVTAAEADAWLTQLEQGGDAEPPHAHS